MQNHAAQLPKTALFRKRKSLSPLCFNGPISPMPRQREQKTDQPNAMTPSNTGRNIISEGSNGGSEETGFCCGLKDHELPRAGVVFSVGGDSIEDRDWLLFRAESIGDRFGSEAKTCSLQAGSKPRINGTAASLKCVQQAVSWYFVAKGSLQFNASGLWQLTLKVSDHLTGSTEGWDHELVSNVRPKLEFLATRLGSAKYMGLQASM